jgi:hypothetical protein
MALIHSAYYKDLMVYYFVPLHAAGAITTHKIDMIEAYAKKQQFEIMGDLKSAII